MNETEKYLSTEFGIHPEVLETVAQAEKDVAPVFARLDDIMAFNQYKVLKAFQKCRISDVHFNWTTGYGYNDGGREALERVFAEIFRAEKALVRPIIVNGTHAISLALAGVLRPGDEMIYCTGKPYDTLEETIGLRGEGKGTLKDFGISYRQVELTPEGGIDLPALEKAMGPRTRMVCLQRATGYGWRKAISIQEIAAWTAFVKARRPDVICMADNCYGEFLDLREPLEAGVDLMAGSLIKNPGGGLALTGGYIAGREDLVDLVSYRLTTPGIGGECGLTFGQTRNMFQGLFLAPRTVNAAVKGAVLCARVFERLGFPVSPGPEEPRNDIVESVELGSPEALTAFCQGVQAAAPIDSYVTPVPGDMPGYEDPVVMAAGAFVQGSTLELSADGPLRPPYIVYFQGGLTYEHSKFGVIKAAQALKDKGLL
ncbi:MAG: methionine gamma-lyase family protein [Bacillota bacterium]|nr:methionine gamma-lyase family protein [Bacillota bacterium]